MMQPNADRRYSHLIYYMLLKAREKSLRCSIGYRILRVNLFNDVFCVLQHQERSSVYLFDVKPHRCRNRTITFSDLKGTSSRRGFDLLRYFKAYLQVRKMVHQPIQELVVWTESTFDRKDFVSTDMLLDYTGADHAVDLFGTDEFGIRRHRLSRVETIEEALLRSCDPLYKLARTLARLMFTKSTVNKDTVPKAFYSALMKDVFEDSSFRKEFMQASNSLCCEAKQFHNLLVLVLGEQFRERNLTAFCKLTQIEQKPFAEFVELRVESCESDSATKDACWKADCTVDRADVEQFFSLLVFYTNVPIKEEFEAKVNKHYDQTTQYVLERVCRREVLLQNAQVEAIFELINLKKSEDLRTLEYLWFEPEALVNLRTVLLKFHTQSTCNTCVIVSCGDLDVSKSRVSRVLDELSCVYLCLSSRDFLEKRNKLLDIMQVLKPSKGWTIVVTTEDSSIIETLGEIECSFIVIVSVAFAPHKANFLIHKDQFCFDDLSDIIKNRLKLTSVLLQGHSIDVGNLLSEDCLSTISVSALLDWFSNCDQIVIGHDTEHELNDDLFVPRKLVSETNVIHDPFEANYDSISILSGLPGSGKTFMIERMAVKFREKFDDHIVIMVDANRSLDSFGANIDGFEMIAKMLNVNISDRFQNFVLRKLLEDHRVILLLDGFDEISLAKQGEALSMLQWIQNADFKSVMIATRPHMLPLLKEKLTNPAVYSLFPLNEEDQHYFLESRIQSASSNEVSDLTRSFQAMFNDENFFEIPLQCSIVAGFCEDHNDHHPSNQWNLADTFQRLVDAKFDLYACKFFDLFSKAHEAAVDAMRISFTNEHSKLAFRMDTLQVIEHECFVNLEQYGLLKTDDGKVSFINSSMVDFFLTLYLVDHYVDQHQFNHYLMDRFCKPTANRFDMFLEHHIRAAVSHRRPQGSAPSILNSDLKEFRPQQTHRLHVDKIKQFHIFLVECCSVEEQIDFLQTSISKGQFSIFETVYQSLPISLFQVVSFTFRSNSNNPLAVDLSTIGEDYLQELLTVLHRQHPSDVVEKIIANYELSEDDFISTAIIFNYRNVIQSIFAIEKNLTSESECDLLLDYVDDRWQQYLTLAVQHGRDDLLAEAFESIGERFHPRVIKHFLVTRSAQQVLIASCKGEEASVEVVRRVIRFAEQYMSEHDLSVLLKRTIEGEGSFGEGLKKLRNQRVREICEALWKRYGLDER